MHRFHLPPEQCSGATLWLTEREAHHGARVLRLRRGEAVTVLDGAGREFGCTVGDVKRDAIELVVTESRLVPPLPCRITLLQALPKGKLFETIVQKATELGVARIVPLLSERVVSRVEDEQAESKAAQWRQVAIEAIKQCGSAWLPQIEAPLTPRQFLARTEASDLSFIASLHPGSRHPREWFQAFLAKRGRLPASVSVWVGPEGDFTAEEVATVVAAGAQPITLGGLVLRCDTAAVYCLSVIRYEVES